jgi:hypothetical protein
MGRQQRPHTPSRVAAAELVAAGRLHQHQHTRRTSLPKRALQENARVSRCAVAVGSGETNAQVLQ